VSIRPFCRYEQGVRRTCIVIAAVAGMCCVAAARAGDSADSGQSMFSLSGFGTLGAAHSGEDQADFVSNTGTLVPDGAGYSRRWSFDVDSRIAAQLTANFNSRLSAVVQIIAEQQANNTYTPTVEWANIKYDFTPDFSVRLGRTILPAFLTSTYRKVGYANPWVRPPIEVYNLLPISNNDGVDTAYKLHLGDATNTIETLYGQKDTKSVGGGTVRARDTWEIADTLEYGDLTAHITYHQVRVSLAEGTPFFPIRLFALGASYDPGDWFVMGEFAANRTDAIGNSNGWYVTGGYRIRDFTPYLTYSRLDALSNPDLGFPPAGQKNISAGVRWDFYRDFDLKLQYEHIDLDAGSAGTLSNIQPGFQPGGTVNVTSMVVDFVF